MRPGRAAGLAALALLSACASPPYSATDRQSVTEPDASDVAAVLFLAGDAGQALVDRSPLVHQLRRQVEHWSAALPRDSSVTVLFLGDNVYPAGVHDPGTDAFARDTAHLGAQAWTVDGPEARTHGTRAVFLPGNHDWANLPGGKGLPRLRNEEQVLESWARAGRPVSLQPRAGSPGPVALDVGPALVILFDTEWWLHSDDDAEKERAIESIEDMILSGNGRPVIFAAHHPLVTAGQHGRRHFPDLLWVLGRTGSMVQDVNSPPYAEMRAALSRAFAQSDRPLAYVAGHDHSLQVIRSAGPGQPGWTLVSGAGSKTSTVSAMDGLEWGAGQPGFMRLMFLRDGSVQLFVESAPLSTLLCPATGDVRACVERGVAAYRTTWSARLR